MASDHIHYKMYKRGDDWIIVNLLVATLPSDEPATNPTTCQAVENEIDSEWSACVPTGNQAPLTELSQ